MTSKSSEVVQNHTDPLFRFTDGSKNPYAAIAVYIPMSDIYIKKRLSDHFSELTKLFATNQPLRVTNQYLSSAGPKPG